MPPDSLPIALIFILAGMVKGISGMGLPTVSMGLLGLLMSPAEAAALIVIPSTITNVWQYAAGPNRLAIARRLWPMLIPIVIATWAAAGLLTGGNAGNAAVALGAILIVYAIIGLAKVRIAAL